MEQSYKEKYEQALSKAKDMLNYKEVRREDMEYLFPELAKSEDEKIRKEIITYLKSDLSHKTYGDKSIESWVAWLEKQGEKHPDPYNGISFEYNGHIWGMCARDNGVDISCDKHLIKHLENQGEENKGNIGEISPNWSEEDEMILSLIVNNLQYIRDTLSHDDKYTVDVGSFEGQIEWLQSLKDRVQPQPKQEWSEEDEKMLMKALNMSEWFIGRKISDCNQVSTWLKSLRPQNHWKPSELQLGCLSDAIKHYNSLGYPASKLKELLDDLKKLNGGEI